jgi:hypothetical protein
MNHLQRFSVTQVVMFKPAIALVDIHLPTMSGETMKLISVNSPRTAVLVDSRGTGSRMAMIASGGSAVINKADVIVSLYPAILGAARSLKAAISKSSLVKSVKCK